MKRLVLVMMIVCTFAIFACGGDDYLSVEVVDDAQVPGTGGAGDGDTGDTQHGLFNNPPGTLVPIASFVGVVDPVGTTLADDFDGDAIDNVDETTSNVWVADYPVVETNISTPVTMKIEILNTASTQSKSLSSEITSSDVNSTSDLSTEAVHRNEINLRTVQFQDTFNTSKESSYGNSQSRSSSVGVTFGNNANGQSNGGANYDSSRGNSISESYKNAYGETKTKWADVPFKNNTNKKGWALKTNEVAKAARTLRNDLRTEYQQGYEIKSNAGYVRAALYIDNLTVNMPVKLRNILCSFMLETPEGQLLPVQSFRLRNDDYSIFEIDLYGESTFGPYVIELKNLNTNEIKDAISRGYNPKIFIVDYEMVHVEDSNYRLALSGNFPGENLKIIEENAKGRTAGIKLLAPGLREFYRVVAFNTDGAESRTGSSGAIFVSPGVPLEKALERVGYSGKTIEFANYVFDFTGFNPPLNIVGPDGIQYGPRFHVRSVKSIDGTSTAMPCAQEKEESDGSITYIMKPITEWTTEEFKNFKIWAVFAKGKYYFHSEDLLDSNGHILKYEYVDNNGVLQIVPMVKGVRNIIWPGDHYDITYLDLGEYYGLIQNYGRNPLETYEVVPFSTRWSGGDFGEYPFYPNQHSVYLGEAAPGDTIEVKIKLKDTYFLNPNFGTPDNVNGTNVYGNFSYNWKKSTKKFNIEEAVDFEISYGLGGEQSDWVHIMDPYGKSPYSAYSSKIHIDEDYSWDFMEQEFILKLKIDGDIKGVDAAKGVKLYMRPSVNNVYRESIWPLPYAEVKKFRGVLASNTAKGNNVISVDYPAVDYDSEGNPEILGDIFMRSSEGIVKYTVDSHASNADKTRYDITLTVPLNENHLRGEQVYIELSEAERPAKQELRLAIDDGFFTEWNSEYAITPPSQPKTMDGYIQLLTGNDPSSPARYLGLNTDYVIENWIGANNYGNPTWNNWGDGGLFNKILSKPFYTLLNANSKYYRLLINDKVLYPFSFPMSGGQIKTYGSRAIVVGTDMYCHIYELAGDTPHLINATEPFKVTTKETMVDNVNIAVANGKAFIAWKATGEIRGRVLDVSGLSPTPLNNMDEFVIVNNCSDWDVNGRSFVSSGERVMVAWVTDVDADGNNEIHGRLYDINTGAIVPVNGAEEFEISTTINRSCFMLRMAAAGNRVVVVWNSGIYGVSSDVRGRIFDVSGDTPGAVMMNSSDNEFIISEERSGGPVIDCNEERAFIVWATWSADLSRAEGVYGRVLSVAGNNPGFVGTQGVMKINTTDDQWMFPTSVKVIGSRAIVVWGSQTYNNVSSSYSWDVRGTVYDINTNEPSAVNNMTDFLINEAAQLASGARVINIDNMAGVFYSGNHDGINSLSGLYCRNYDILRKVPGPMLNQLGYKVGGYPGSASNVESYGKRIIIPGLGITDILGNTGELLHHGNNAMCIYPLMERLYDVQVKIVE